MGLQELQNIKANADKTPKFKMLNGKKFYAIPKQSAKKKAASMENGKFVVDAELEKWFEYGISQTDCCDNCGANLFGYSKKDLKNSQHHVLEKSLFPTVKYNRINRLVLGMWCCHSQWHTSMLNASKMAVFERAKEIVKNLYPLLPDDEKRKLSEFYLPL